MEHTADEYYIAAMAAKSCHYYYKTKLEYKTAQKWIKELNSLMIRCGFFPYPYFENETFQYEYCIRMIGSYVEYTIQQS